MTAASATAATDAASAAAATDAALTAASAAAATDAPSAIAASQSTSATAATDTASAIAASQSTSASSNSDSTSASGSDSGSASGSDSGSASNADSGSDSDSPAACPYALCASFLRADPAELAGEMRGVLCRIFSAARADPAFMAEVGSVAGEVWMERAEVWVEGLAESRRSGGDQLIRRGSVPSYDASHPVMAAVMWFAARPGVEGTRAGERSEAGRLCPPPLQFTSLVELVSVDLLLRASRRSVERIEFVGGACFVPEARRPSLAALRRCERLHTVMARSIPPTYREDLCAALAEFAPPSLTTLDLEFFPAYEGPDGRAAAAWTTSLPRSLRRLQINGMARGIAHAIARSCPDLTSLRLVLNDYGGPASEARPAAEEADQAAARACPVSWLLASLRSLETLELEETTLTARMLDAIASLPRLRVLKLSEVEGGDDEALTPTLRDFGRRVPSLQTLWLVNSLYRCETELLPLLEGLRFAVLTSLRLRVLFPGLSPASVVQVAEALGRCLAVNPVTELGLYLDAKDSAAALAVAAAVARARLTLCDLDIKGVVPPKADIGRFHATLGECTLLRRVSLDSIRRCCSDAMLMRTEAYDGLISEAMQLIVARSPQLALFDTSCIASRPLRIHRPHALVGTNMSRTVGVARTIAKTRSRQCTGRAWAVVRAGLYRNQERRLAAASGAAAGAALGAASGAAAGAASAHASAHASAPAPAPRTSPLDTVPPAVLRHVGNFLQTKPVALYVM